MTLLKRILGFLQRLLRGEDVVLVSHTREQWEQQFAAGKWNRLQEGQPNTAELARLIFDYADTKGGRLRVLDVGCGNGGLARLIADTVDYTGIDIATSAITSAREVAPHGTFIVGDAMNPPENLGVFDVVVFNEVFYYMNPDRSLSRYHIHATADARIFISVLHFWRTPFVFQRIRRYMHFDTRFYVSDDVCRWDIAVGHFI